jgi:hypothetical protein
VFVFRELALEKLRVRTNSSKGLLQIVAGSVNEVLQLIPCDASRFRIFLNLTPEGSKLVETSCVILFELLACQVHFFVSGDCLFKQSEALQESLRIRIPTHEITVELNRVIAVSSL